MFLVHGNEAVKLVEDFFIARSFSADDEMVSENTAGGQIGKLPTRRLISLPRPILLPKYVDWSKFASLVPRSLISKRGQSRITQSRRMGALHVFHFQSVV